MLMMEDKQTNNLRINSLKLPPMKVFRLTRHRREEGRIAPNEAEQPTRKSIAVVLLMMEER